MAHPIQVHVSNIWFIDNGVVLKLQVAGNNERKQGTREYIVFPVLFVYREVLFNNMMFFNHEPFQTFFSLLVVYIRIFVKVMKKNKHYTWFLVFYFRPRAIGDRKLRMETFLNYYYFTENEGELLYDLSGQKGHGTTSERSLSFLSGTEIKKWYRMNFINSTETTKCLEKNLAP